jgi:hypothetical protein
VSDQRAVNLTSLNIVKNEFLATIQLATNQLEQYISARDRQDLVDAALESFQQIDGVFRIVQLQGADLLTVEIIDVLKNLPPNADASINLLKTL